MKRTFLEAVQHRRSYYSIGNTTTLPDDKIKAILGRLIETLPSAFNSQSSRIVLLLGKQHTEFWKIVSDTLRGIVKGDFSRTEAKLATFSTGHGTVLFYEDNSVVKSLQEQFPAYAANFPVWAQHASAIHQFAVWTALEDEGLGASLQHYNPIIDEAVAAKWAIHSSWQLIAQMPFGTPSAEPAPKDSLPVDGRFLVFE